MSRPFDRNALRRFAACAVLAAGLCGLSLLMAGCRDETTTITSAPLPSGDAARRERDPEECQDLLDRAWNTVQPERMGVTVEPEVTVRTLNDWLNGCVPPDKKDADVPPVPLELPAATRAQMQSDRFTARDVLHVRNAILHEKTTRFAALAEDDLGRVVDLFYYVVENIALPGSDEEALPQTPFETWLFGRGTAEDRAWVFAELLRQLHLDAVILRPNTADGAAEEAWLVGVLLGGEVYLFDPRLGWPIPSADAPDETARVRQPATLAQVVENPELLRQLDVDGQPYPLAADDLKFVQVELIGYGSVWTPPMGQLQRMLAGDRSVVVYEPLTDGPMQTGLLSRVAAAGKGHWDKDDIAVWPYPESQLQAAERLDPEQSNRQQSLWEPMTAPRPIRNVVVDPQTGALQEVVLGDPERDQLKTRIQQLLGDFDTAVSRYVAIRMAARMPPLSRSAKDVIIPESVRPQIAAHIPGPVQRLHREAAEDAYFWTGLAKRMQGRHEAAADTFAGYLEQYPDGDWTVQARALRALMLAEQQQFAAAAAALDGIPSDHPQSAGLRLLQQRWTALSDADDAAPVD